MERKKIYDTRLISRSDEEGIADAAAAIRRGEVVAFPTETVYGLGADATDPQAVSKIFEAKGRPGDNPLIVHIADKSQIDMLVRDVTPAARALIDAFMPGPITVIMNKSDAVPDIVTAGIGTVGIRMPSHEVCNKFLKLAGCPVAAPSANLSGSPSPTTAIHVMNDMDGYIYAVIDGGRSEVGLESTVVDATGDVPVILRPGAVTSEMIDEVLNVKSEYAGALKPGEVPASPGMKYRHYAPRCEVKILTLPQDIGDIDPESDDLDDDKKQKLFSVASPFILEASKIIKDRPFARIGIYAGSEVVSLFRKAGDQILLSHCEFYDYGKTCDVKAASHGLFDGLRVLDRQEVDVILASGFKGSGLEVAYMNRLSKAAGKKGEDVPSAGFDETQIRVSDIPLDMFNNVFTASVLFISDEDLILGAYCEGIMTDLIRRKGGFCSQDDMNTAAELYAESAGLAAEDGYAPDRKACDVFKAKTGSDVSHHLSRRAGVSVYDANDLILTINDEQAFGILNAYPELTGKVYSLSSYMASKGLVIKGDDGRVASVSLTEPSEDDTDACVHTVSALKAWLEILFPYIIKDLGARRFC